MNRILAIAFLTALTACSTPTPQVTASPESTVTLPPASPTPEPTATPESAIDPEIIEAQEFFGDGFEITPEGKVIDKKLGKEIPGFTIIPFNKQTMIPPYKKEVNWGWKRIYEFEDKPDFTVFGTEADIVITEEGGLDMYAWEYKDGAFFRQKVKFAAPNDETVEIEGYSPEEVQYLIIQNNSTDPKYRVNSHEARRQMSIRYIPKKVINRIVYATYMNMLEPQDNYYYFYGNIFLPVLDNQGTWSAVETTMFMVHPEFKERSKAFVVWMSADNKPVIVVIEGKYLEMPEYFNPYWKNHDIEDPFTP